MGNRRLWVGLAVVAGLVAASVLLPVGTWLKQFLDWVEGLGRAGPLALGGLYVLACVLFIPGSILTLGAGALFGVVGGSVTVSLASTLGAMAAFLVGRHLARDAIAARIAGNARFSAVDAAVGREGFKIVLLTRLSPVFPFNLLNYAFGLTGVSLKDYVLASWIGMLPGTVLYVYLGAATGEIARAATGEGRSPAQWALFGVGLAATVAVTVLVTRIARRALDRAVGSPAAGSAQGQA